MSDMDSDAHEDPGGAGEAAAAGARGLRATMDALLDPHVVFATVRDESGAIVDFVYVDANAAACAYNRLSRRDLIGARLLQRLPGVRQSGLFAAYCRVVETGEPLLLDGVTYESDLGDAQQSYFDIRGVRLGDGLSLTWHDVTDRHLASEALRAQRDLAVALSATSDLARALDTVMEAALALDGVDCGGIYLVDPADGGLRLTVHAGVSAEFAGGVSHFTSGAPQTRQIMAGVSVYATYDDLRAHPGTQREVREGLRALASAPIRHEGLVVAAVNLASRTQVRFTRQQSALIETLAAQVGGAIVRLRAEDARREELERLRAVPAATGAETGGGGMG